MVVALAFGVAPAMAGTAASIAATEGQQFMGSVDTIAVPCSNISNATINWGDGTPTSGGGTFETGTNSCGIEGTHTYAEEGSYNMDVTYTVPGGGMGSDLGTAAISDAQPGVSAVNDFSVAAGSAISGVVANWSDPVPEALSSYSAIINWGDGISTAGTIVNNGTITASHTYANGARFPITVTFHDEGGGSATAREHANVSGCPHSAPSTPAPSFDPPDVGLNVRYVEALYHDVLGRSPSAAEASAAIKSLSLGGTRHQLALALVDSSEYRKSLVALDYEAYLHRVASSGDVSYWLSHSGVSDEGVIGTIVGSAEYYSTRGNSSSDGFLSAMYCDTVFRSIDQFTQNNEDALLGSGTQRSAIATGLLNSTEYLATDVNGYYLRYLRRAGTPTERNVGASFIKSSSDELLIASLLASTEYFEIFNPKVAVATTLVAQGGTVSTTLSRYAKLTLTVLHVVPNGHAFDIKLRSPHTRLVGTVNFGFHHKGKVKLHWNRKVHGKRLKEGQYLLILKAYNKHHKLIGIADATKFTVR